MKYTCKVKAEQNFFDKIKSNKKEEFYAKKINLKIKKEDLDLIEYVAESKNITKSSILNEAIENLLKKEIDSVDEMDAKLIIAKAADELYMGASEEIGRWTLWVLRDEIKSLQGNYLRWNCSQQQNWDVNNNNSDQFLVFKKRIEG